MSRRPAKPKPSNPARSEPQIAKPLPAGSPSGYAAFLEDVKSRIRTAQVKAALSVNRKLITLYWDIGKTIVEAQKVKGYGKQVVERLAEDLHLAFPTMGGLSARNVWRMRAFYLAWTEESQNLQQPVREFDSEILPQLVAELDGENLPPPVAEIPWGHNVWLMEKISHPLIRLWYVHKTIPAVLPLSLRPASAIILLSESPLTKMRQMSVVVLYELDRRITPMAGRFRELRGEPDERRTGSAAPLAE